MSANQPPFPSYGDQQERTGSPSNKKSSQLFPPQLRVGRGQTTGPFSGAFQPNPVPIPNNAPTNASFNPVFQEDATQAYQPPAYQPSPFQPSGAFGPTGQQQPGPSHLTGPATGPSAFAPASFPAAGAFNPNNPQAADTATRQFSPATTAPTGSSPLMPPGQFGGAGDQTIAAMPGQPGNVTRQLGSPTRQLGNTGMLPGQNMPGEYSGDTGMLTLNQAVKVVRIPVAGKPGEFKTGILPVLSQPTAGNVPPSMPAASSKARNKNKLILFTVLILLVVVGSVSALLLHGTGSSPSGGNGNLQTSATNKNNSAMATATANAQATATAVTEASLIVSDPLSSSSNARGWFTAPVPTKESGGNVYVFRDNAYHIIPGNDGYFAYALMGSQQLPKNYTYTLTMQSGKYDSSNAYSFYGMIVNFKNYGGGKESFYIFRINSGTNFSYEFDKYDNRNTGPNDNPYQQLYPDPNNAAGTGQGNGKELKSPHGANVYSISARNGTFTLLVNNVKIGSVKDTTFTSGGLGMCVNQKGSDVAFTNLALYNN